MPPPLKSNLDPLVPSTPSSSTRKPPCPPNSSESRRCDFFILDKPRDRALLPPRKSNFNHRLNAPLPLHAPSSAARNVRSPVSHDNYHRALNILPTEIIDRVAFFLPRDRDICNLDSTCLHTHAAISHPRSGIWIQRFADTFDIPASIWGVGVNFQAEYKCRQWMRKLLRERQIHVVGRVDAIRNNEGAVIEFVRELIGDSFAVLSPYNSSPTQTQVSKNLLHLAEVTANSFFLDNSMRFASDPALSFPQLQLYRLVLTHLALDDRARIPHCFEYSQQAVYGHPLDFPLLTDGPRKSTLHLGNLLHIVNFFKYHITSADEHTLHSPFHALPADEKPQPWVSPVKYGLQKLGTHWKGCSAYLHNNSKLAPRIRTHTPGTHIYSDVIDVDATDDGFLSLHLDFSRPAAPWPPAFETHLRSEGGAHVSTDATTTRNGQSGSGDEDQERWRQFQGTSNDGGRYSCVGYVSALPAQDPQAMGPVAGFQRVTMMKWPDGEDRDEGPGGQTAVEAHLEARRTCADLVGVETEYWAYEGVVLPGGRVMLGRWWSPRETPPHDLDGSCTSRARDPTERKCTGPFLFWEVDGTEGVGGCEECGL